MTDAYVYYFTMSNRLSGKTARSKRLATLEAIKGRGEPVMETQTTVDQTELDSEGFLVGRSVGGSDPGDELWGEIRSLVLRATSRDREAQGLDESAEGRLKYMLSVESRELRGQARRLQKLREDILAAETNEAGAGFYESEVCQDAG